MSDAGKRAMDRAAMPMEAMLEMLKATPPAVMRDLADDARRVNPIAAGSSMIRRSATGCADARQWVGRADAAGAAAGS